MHYFKQLIEFNKINDNNSNVIILFNTIKYWQNKNAFVVNLFISKSIYSLQVNIDITITTSFC